MIESSFTKIQAMMGKPLFWAGVILGLFLALLINILSGNKFDPNMSYANFIQNWVQVLALGVTSVGVCAMAMRDNELHDKVDALHDKHDNLHNEVVDLFLK